MAPTLPGPVALTVTIASCMLGGFWFAQPKHREEFQHAMVDLKEDAKIVQHELAQGMGHLVDGVEHGVHVLEEVMLRKAPKAIRAGSKKVSTIVHKAEAKVIAGYATLSAKFSEGAQNVVSGLKELRQEIKEHMNRAIVSVKQSVHCSWAKFDTNGDGHVTISELIKKLDDNGDGEISLKEWLADTCQFAIVVKKDELKEEPFWSMVIEDTWTTFVYIVGSLIAMAVVAKCYTWYHNLVYPPKGELHVQIFAPRKLGKAVDQHLSVEVKVGDVVDLVRAKEGEQLLWTQDTTPVEHKPFRVNYAGKASSHMLHIELFELENHLGSVSINTSYLAFTPNQERKETYPLQNGDTKAELDITLKFIPDR